MPTTAVVFVHGFNSGPETWNSICNRLQADPGFPNDRFQLVRFKYPTQLFQINPVSRIPSVADCGDALGTFLDSTCADAGAIVLVGHSMGGLVIEAYLVGRLNGNGGQLKRIRGVIQFATPNRGSNALFNFRDLCSKIAGKNPQNEALQTLAENTDDTLRTIERQVLRASEITPTTCPIPFQVFYGMEDRIVTKVSARGPFDEPGALPGNHFEILNVDRVQGKDTDGAAGYPEQRYRALVKALLDPVGHPSIYEIERFAVLLQISPVSNDVSFQIPDLDHPLTVHTDNVATRTITIDFAAQNRCHIPYKQVYRSVDGHVQFLSAMGPAKAVDDVTDGVYRSEGKVYTYIFTPDAQDSFSMRLKIFNGFGEGNRNWHNHMEKNAHYRKFVFTLDLSAYETAGFTLSKAPRLCRMLDDRRCEEVCKGMTFGETTTPSLPSTSPWVQTWELPDVQGGVIDIAWDVAPTPRTATQ